MKFFTNFLRSRQTGAEVPDANFVRSRAISAPAASRMPAALSSVSCHSRSGTESATMPAPTWKCAAPASTTTVRMAMLNWLSPLNPNQPIAPV